MSFRTASLSLMFALLSTLATGCLTTSSRWHHATGFDVPCPAGSLMDATLLVCVPAGFAAAEVPDVPLEPATAPAPSRFERKLVVKKDAIVTMDPMMGMVDDDVLFAGAFAVAGHHVPTDEGEVVQTKPKSLDGK